MALQERTAVSASGKRTAAEKVAATQRNREMWGAIGRYIAVVVVVVIALAPLYLTFIKSIENGVEINATPRSLLDLLFPHTFDTSNYAQVAQASFFLLDLRNSAIISVITTLLALLFGILAAYAIARMRFAGKGLVLAIILSVQMFPFIAMVGPLYVLFTGPLYVYNTYVALIIPDLVITLPLTVWFLTSFFRDLPPDLEEAARVDGASRMQALWHVIVPLTAPGVFASAILSFIAVWNDFLFGLTLTNSTAAQPVTVGILQFNTEHTIAYGQLAAASIIVTVPLVILVLFLQRRIVAGLTAGAVKG